MRKHTFLRAKIFLRRRAENAVFGGSFRQRRQKIPLPPAGKSARFFDVSRACFTAENPREKSVGNSGFSRGFRAKFTQFSSLLYREILWCEIVRAAGMICRSRLSLCGECADRQFRLCRNCRAAAVAFRGGRKHRCRRRRQAFPQDGKAELRLHAPYVPRVLHAACGGFPARHKM